MARARPLVSWQRYRRPANFDAIKGVLSCGKGAEIVALMAVVLWFVPSSRCGSTITPARPHGGAGVVGPACKPPPGLI